MTSPQSMKQLRSVLSAHDSVVINYGYIYLSPKGLVWELVQKVILEGAATGFVCCLHSNIETQGLRQPLVQAE